MNRFTQPIVSETPADRYTIGRLLLTLIIAATAVTAVRADRGAIPFKRQVAVFEPNQRALLAWNGTERITISQTNQGTTSIQLLVLTPDMLRTFSGVPIERVGLRHEPVDLTSTKVRPIHPELDGLLGHRDEVK